MPLETAYIFERLGDNARAAIAAIALEETHESGSVIFQAGELATDLYILEEGRVRQTVLRGGLLSHIISQPGTAMGWSSMTGTGTYTATAVCTGPVRLLRIPAEELVRIFDNDPINGMAFYRRLAELIVRRLVESYGATLSLAAQIDPRSYG